MYHDTHTHTHKTRTILSAIARNGTLTFVKTFEAGRRPDWWSLAVHWLVE